MKKILLALMMLALATIACVRDTPEVIVITATFLPQNTAELALATSTPIGELPLLPSVTVIPNNQPSSYVVRPGDTLTIIAEQNGTTVETLLEINDIADQNTLFVGQIIELPSTPLVEGSEYIIMADSKLVRGPGVSDFDVLAFAEAQNRFISRAVDEVNHVELTAGQVVNRVSLEYSVDPRLLFALLEYLGGWLSRDTGSEDNPLGAPAYSNGVDRRGVYLQLAWAADNLNRGYYAKQAQQIRTMELADGTRVRINQDINAATTGLQYLFSRIRDYNQWQKDVSPEGFALTYRALFGDPFQNSIVPLVPDNLTQPTLELPFANAQTWFYTGGPHGGWGSGSAWAAVDFAPPDDLDTVTSSCYVSSFYATAAAPGVIARTDEGTVVLDLDGDGDESTGWTILYLHIASEGRINAGASVSPGDRIGRPSCEGGFSNGTHLHLARRYNGEWIPADCSTCVLHPRPAFVIGAWAVLGLPNQEYQGYMTNGSRQIVAEQGRNIADNRITWQ
ncbi:MAG: LysM peptidoglycan-binding domain-containing protein [Anaerolineae bacterium]|nr:LysM peptidoglycan-binding domain-containing protein [Anaerolineae bacterium]